MIFRNTSKFLLALSVPLLLMFGQQAAIRHEIGHLTPPSERTDQQLPAHNICEECGVYSQLTGGVATTFQPLAVVATTFHFFTEIKTVAIALEIPASRNRGPPVFL